MKNITILGSTGSIGTQTLDVVRNNEGLRVVALAAYGNDELMEKQVREFSPLLACMWDEKKAESLRIRIKDTGTRVVSGMDGLIEAATLSECDTVVTAIVGMIGIRPTVAAINAGKDIALANKETLVTAGQIIMPLCSEKKVKILPVDSEHSAIFQSLNGEDRGALKKILLTASGGPFRGKKKNELENVTVREALCHPNWAMGPKITVDSASLVNKGLEVIEAKWLFNVEAEDVCVVVHPQSIIHSAVEFEDGAVIAQLGLPDMKLPIQYALFYPKRLYMPGEKLDLFKIKNLTFEEPDRETFKGLDYAYSAIKTGGTMPCVFNAANEMAVRFFLEGKIRFLQIYDIINDCMENVKLLKGDKLEDIFEAEQATYDHIKGMVL
ncbi:MAG: 1-deoxy-D-xylulose-5-phosphate reductoisomerase [Lachnospiraceae bacterium]|nr:1-deoxy-D-xylulose-5-phosphate reductoisomerase [Lachnospiraceae bacterium]